MKAFLADDSLMMREQIGNMLAEMENVEIVGEAGTVQDAEQGILESMPDLVFLDIQMPGGGSGIDVLRKIKKELPGTKVVVLTNFPYFQYRVQCIALGADHFLDKHREYGEISNIVRRLQWGIKRRGFQDGEDLP